MPEELMPVQGWWDVAKSLPSDLPDEAYNAQREKYYEQVVMPWAYQQGHSETQTRQVFDQSTERPGKSRFPRAAVAGTQALESFAAPFVKGSQVGARLEAAKKAAVEESQKQDISTTLPTMAGQMIGEAPYWAAGMEAAGAVSGMIKAGQAARSIPGGVGPLTKEAALKLTTTSAVDRLTTTAAAGAIQGSYDAAKSDAHPITDGLVGFAEGAAFVGALESAGPLWRYIRGVAPQATVEEAKAVEALAKGIATPEQEKIGAKVVNNQPDLMNHVKMWVQRKVQQAKKDGVPDLPPEVETTGKIKLFIKGKDGKVIPAGGPAGIDIKDMPKLVEQANKWLDAGGSIQSIRGDATVLDSFYRILSDIKKKAEKPEEIIPKGQSVDAPKVVLVPEKEVVEKAAEAYAPQTADKLIANYRKASETIKSLGRDTEILDTLIDDFAKGDRDMESLIQSEIQDHITKAKKRAAGPNVEDKTGPDSTPASDAEKFALSPIGEKEVAGLEPILESLETGGKKKAPKLRTGGEKSKIKAEDLSIETRFEVRYDGKVKDITNGIVYQDMGSALKAAGIQARPSFEDPTRRGLLRPDSPEEQLKTSEWRKSRAEKDLTDAEKSREYWQYELSKKTALTRTPAQLGEEGKGGVMMRYQQGPMGGTPVNAPLGTVERPMYDRTVTDDPMAMPTSPGAAGVAMFRAGEKPSIYYLSGTADKGTIFHETMHAKVGYLGLTQEVANIFEDSMGKKMLGAFEPHVSKALKDNGMWGEEVFTYLSEAVRTKKDDWVQAFVDADGSHQELMTWLYNNTNKVLDQLAGKNDSIYKRRLVTRLEDLKLRAGSIADLERRAETLGKSLRYEDERWNLYDPQDFENKVFGTRTEIEDHLLKEFSIPELAPELVDYSSLPEGFARASYNTGVRSPNIPPTQTDPLPLNPPQAGALKGGWKPFSFFLRPREQWFESVSRENQWPELYDGYRRVVDAQRRADQFTTEWETKLGDILGDALKDPDRRKAIGAYRHNKGSEQAAKDLNLAPAEVAISKRITEEITNPLFKEFGIGDHAKYVEEYLPRLKAANWDPDQLKPTSALSPEEMRFWAELNRTGNLDPRDNDVARVLGAYIRAGARKKFMEEPLADLARLNNLKTETGNFVTGNLQPLIDRTIKHWRGQPDYTQNIVNGAVNSFIEGVAQQVKKVNSLLPDKLKIDSLDELKGSDLLGKWTTLMYAGSLGFRPMAYVRDGLQFLMTTYPLLGGKYLLEGIGTVISGAKEGRAGTLYQIPKKYGAIVEHSPLADLYSTSGSVGDSRLMRFAEMSMKGMKFENDINRMISFWGHQKKMFDAIASNPGDVAKQARDGGLLWLPPTLKDRFAKELAEGLKDPSDFSFRVAKELTDMSQWNYTRGASPGLYKYGLGRLFGMYGTWPMSYIEYSRSIFNQIKGGDREEGIKAAARLVAAHSTIFMSAQLAGIDAGNWVFSQPGAFGGSPLYNSIMAIPGSIDFETVAGQKARRELVQPIFPLAIPGGLTLTKLIEAVSKDDPNAWMTIMGFKPMAAGEYEKGIHQLGPHP